MSARTPTHDPLSPLHDRYPEIAAGGFTRVDGTVAFYSRVRALLEPGMVVVDFGAGRGQGPAEDPVRFRRDLQTLRGGVARVIGIDVDAAVEENPAVDDAIVLPGSRSALPLDDESVDLIVADHVLEHLEDPAHTARELTRVLRPGGWLCARTPNRWGYIGVGARIVPNQCHARLLGRLQPDRQVCDVFPTTYLLNTRTAIREHFAPEEFDDHTYGFDSEPAYAGRSKLGTWVIGGLARLTPERFKATWMVFLRKRRAE